MTESDGPVGPVGAVLDAVSEARPRLAADLRALLAEAPPAGAPPAVEPATARDGAASLTVNGRWIHSSFAPAREAERLAAAIEGDADADGTLILGFGLGYVFEALEAAGEREAPRPWVALSCHPAILQRALEQRSGQWWLDHGPDRILPAWLPGLLVPSLQEAGIRRFALLRVPGETRLFPDVDDALQETIARYRERIDVNRNTLRRFGQLWVRNTIRSTGRFGVFAGIEPLMDIATGVPAVVCAAGPTLDDVLPELADAAKGAILIAVDTAVAALARHGITPDIAVISDPQYWNTRHLDRADGGGALLVAEPATHPRTLRLWRGPVRMSASLFPLGAFFDRAADRTRKLGAGGSVTTSAWDLARLMGTPSIALAGADLGFPRYQTHCRGSFFEGRLQARATRVNPAEHGMWQYLHGARATTVATAGGGSIPSDSRMQVYRSWFAEQSAQHPEVETVLLSSDSSAIAGVPYEPLHAWYARHGSISAATDARTDLAAASGPSPRWGRDTLTALRETLREIDRIAEEGLSVCQRLATRGAVDLSDLDAVDRRLAVLPDREIAGFVAGDALDEVTRARPTTTAEAIAVSESFYRTLRDAVAYHRNLLDRTVFS